MWLGQKWLFHQEPSRLSKKKTGEEKKIKEVKDFCSFERRRKCERRTEGEGGPRESKPASYRNERNSQAVNNVQDRREGQNLI